MRPAPVSGPCRISALMLLLLACCLTGMAPEKACAQATTIGRPFSGDAGSEFSYSNFVVDQDRTLTGTLTNTASRPRRDVVVEITAIGLQSRAPVWSVTQRFSEIPPQGTVDIQASYGRFTAEPGAFTFRFTETTAPPEPMAAPSQEPPPVEGDSPTRNFCSSIRSEGEHYLLEGTGNCDTVAFMLEPDLVRFEITRKGSDPMSVELLDNEKQFVAPLAAGSTYRTVKATAKITLALHYRLRVTHSGKWSIRVIAPGLPLIEGDTPADTAPRPDAPQGKRFELILE